MTQEAPLVIKNREELIFILSEASALEHMIMCQYLFAVFSLKRDVSEGVTAAQLEAIKRWDRTISQVAAQEMLHLALVSNLLTSIGSVPFFNRPNFPQRSKYYPPHIQMVLRPFSEQALQHFLYLERPEGMDLQDAPELQILQQEGMIAGLDDDQIVPEAQSFLTVGHLYRSIEQGFRLLVDQYGEQGVFIGPPRAQASQQHFGWPELVPVTNLASAIQAIETIVEQGEGARGDWRDAHFGKFWQTLQEYRELKQQDPNFEPARPVLAANVSPASDSDVFMPITEPVTAEVSMLLNASYEVLLQMLSRYFVHGSESDDALRVLSSTAVDAMFMLIKPLGELLTTLPIGPHAAGKNAGAVFAIFRTGYILPHRYAAWTIFHERLLQMAEYCDKIIATHPSAPKDLAGIGENARQLAAKLDSVRSTMDANTH
ncbi:MAG TPA: ferritin-like protein [Ktedonobacteraceae bacterium]|nr:ferritin-like protein [Ktedonobacteraceae bacterium]